MSAIAAVYIPSCGFVIGADGRGRWTEPSKVDVAKRKMESNTEVKIFDATSRHGYIAFGLTGSAYNEDKSISVAVECQKAAAAVSNLQLANYLEYVEKFSEIVRESIAAAHAAGRFDYDPPEDCLPELRDVISRLLFCGYFRTRPFCYDVTIRNENGILVCYPTQCELRGMTPMVVGSGKIRDLLYGKRPDKRLQKFAVKVDQGSSQMVAIACVRGCLEAHCTPLAREIDPWCKNVGGDIRIAAVTPQFGFGFLTPPPSTK